MKFRPLKNERGAILVIALIFVCILAIAGTMAYRMTASELMIAGNFNSSKEVFYAASAGLEEARDAPALPVWDPPVTTPDSKAIYDPATATSTPPYPNPNWTAYVLATSSWQTSDDPDYFAGDTNYIPNSSSQTNTSITTNSLQTELEYWVKVRHKTEYDAEEEGHDPDEPLILYYDNDGYTTGGHTSTNRGNIIVYGYPNPFDQDNSSTPPYSGRIAQPFTPPGATSYRPVDIITAYGIGEKSRTTIRTEIVHDPGSPLPAALYAENDVSGHAYDSSITAPGPSSHNLYVKISGVDNCAVATPNCDFCGVAPDRPYDIYVYSNDPTITTGLESYNNDATLCYPTVANATHIEVERVDVNVPQGITSLKKWKTSSNPADCYNDQYKICLSSGDLSITNQTEGTGILLVEGNLSIEGAYIGTTWKGLILVTGQLTLNGGTGAGITIEGAVLANREVWINPPGGNHGARNYKLQQLHNKCLAQQDPAACFEVGRPEYNTVTLFFALNQPFCIPYGIPGCHRV